MPRYQTIAEAISKVGIDFPQNGYVFQDLKGNETHYGYVEVERLTAGRAKALQDLGLNKGDRVGIVVIEPEDFVLSFLACIRIGVLPVPMYPPMSFGALDAYADKTSRILTNAGASVLVASDKLKNLLYSQLDAVPSLRRFVTSESLRVSKGEPVYPEIVPDDLCFLQYTSGSTSDPKGVMVSHASLIANTHHIIFDALQMEPEKGDKAVSWLPLYHDMGLIGFVIAPITSGIGSVFIPTLRFIKRPSVWMDTVHRHRGNASFAPNFAFALVTRRAKESDLEKWDLSCLKVLGCGAEPIQPATMREFTELYGSRCNLPETSLMPAYGMAEATLAMSLVLAPDKFVTHVVDAETFQGEGKAIPPVEGKPFIENVGCGPAFKDHQLVAMAEDGTILPEDMEGELCLKGASVTPGYFRNAEATAEAYRDGWLHTGDLGYVHDGQIYVTGRIKDLIILNGRNVHPQSIEWAAADVEGVRKGNVIAFSVPGTSSEELVVVAESRGSDPVALADAIRLHVQRELAITCADVLVLGPGNLPKTSSGKLQRRKARQLFLTNKLGSTGSRTMGSSGSKLNLAKHVAKSIWTRAKAKASLI
jgi:fatty-acyl-CoA synthase